MGKSFSGLMRLMTQGSDRCSAWQRCGLVQCLASCCIVVRMSAFWLVGPGADIGLAEGLNATEHETRTFAGLLFMFGVLFVPILYLAGPFVAFSGFVAACVQVGRQQVAGQERIGTTLTQLQKRRSAYSVCCRRWAESNTSRHSPGRKDFVSTMKASAQPILTSTRWQSAGDRQLVHQGEGAEVPPQPACRAI